MVVKKQIVRGCLFVWGCVSLLSASALAMQSSDESLELQEIYTTAFCPDGTCVAAGGRDALVRLWSMQTGKQLQVLRGHSDIVYAVDFHPKGTLLASASRDGTVRIWDLKAGRALAVFRHDNIVWNVRFSPKGTFLASCSSKVHLWDVHNRKQLRVFTRHTSQVNSVAFSPDEQLMASGGDDHMAYVWERETGNVLHAFKRHNPFVSSVDFSPDGKTLALCETTTIQLWDLQKNTSIRQWRADHAWVNHIRFSAQGDHLISAGKATVAIWDINTGKRTRLLLDRDRGFEIHDAYFSPDGSHVVSGCEDKIVRVWKTATGKQLHALKPQVQTVNPMQDSVVPTQTVLVSSLLHNPSKQTDEQDEQKNDFKENSLDNQISSPQLHSPFRQEGEVCNSSSNVFQFVTSTKNTDNQPKKTLQQNSSHVKPKVLMVLQEHTEPVSSVAFSPDGKMLISGSHDKSLKVWDWQNKTSTYTLESHTWEVTGVAVSPRGRMFISSSDDGTVRLWSLLKGTQLKLLEEHDDETKAVAFSANSNRSFFVSASADSTLRLWNADSWKQLHVLKGHDDEVVSVAFSPDGSMLVSGSLDTSIRLWRTKDGNMLWSKEDKENEPIRAVAFSSDKVTLASGGDAKTVQLWNARKGKPGKSLKVPAPTLGLSFSPNKGKLLACAHANGTITIWDTQKGVLLHTLQGHNGEVLAVSFHPTSNQKYELLASGGEDSTVQLWQLP